MAKSKRQSDLINDNLAAFGALDLTAHKTIRLAVSGDVELNRLETSLVDTADFQRLRGINQLGTACLVYPTAVHTRFDHSLGTLQMATQMIQAIRGNTGVSEAERYITTEQEQLIRLLALLHDITHIPFGHTIEDEFCIFPRHDRSLDRLERFVGEGSVIGGRIIQRLGKDMHGRLMALMQAGLGVEQETAKDKNLAEDYFILDMITNTVCADLLDYLRRDAYFCNVAVDTDYRFVRHLAICRHQGRRRMVIRLWKEGKAAPRRDVLNELIRLLDNRYLMGERVYFHHAKLVSGAMVGAAVARAQLAGEIDQEELLRIGDAVLMWKLGQSACPAVRRLTEQVQSRCLWKQVYERHRSAIAAEQQTSRHRDVLEEIVRTLYADAPARLATEDRLAELLGMDSGDLLIYCPHPKMAMKVAEILVFWNGALRPLKDCSDDELVGTKLQSILDSHQNLWAVRTFLSPAHLAQADAVADACDGLLAFEPSRKRRLEKAFYRRVLEGMARQERWGEGLDHVRFEQALGGALEKVARLTEAKRTRKELTRIGGRVFSEG